jgi:cytidine deaminase
MAVAEQTLRDLVAAAREAARRAYCPYSCFPVGAAVLTAGGRVFTGCNVENASYGLSICGERNAAFQAVAAGHKLFLAVAVYTPTPAPTAPCGACRQVLSEFGPAAEVIAACDGPDVLHATLGNLLPSSFGPQNRS